MRLVDADAIKQKYRDKFIESLIDKDRGIDLSEYAEEPSKSFNKFIDEIPTVDVLEQVRNEIVEEQNCWREYTDAEWYECRRILRIIDKYKTDRG